MRKRSESRARAGKRLLGTAAVGLAVAAVAVVAPLVDAAPAAAQDTGEDSSMATSLFTSLGEGAAGQVGGAAAGWAMSALGLSSGDDEAAELATINADLNVIINELADIEAELQALESAITQMDCDALSANTDAARTLIDSLSTTYQSFVDEGAGTFGTATVPPTASMVQWAADVTDEVNGVGPAILSISNALLPAGSAQGIISACLQPSVIAPPVAYTLSDVPYYDQVANLINFYYTYQARGLLLLQEAYHFQAQQASGQTTPPDQPGDICTSATDSAAISACTTAVEYTNDLYERLAAQFELAGLPYTDDEVILLNNKSATPPLFVRSLEKFTAAAGDDCPTPLTAADPCGVTVANFETVDDEMNVSYAGYKDWKPATYDDLVHLISNRGSERPGDYMNSQGFENASDKVIITSESESFELPLGDPVMRGTQGCFLHTNLRTYCGQDDVINDLLELYHAGNFPCNDSPQWRTKSGLPTDVHNFFTADTHVKVVDTFDCEWKWTTEPGWLVGNTGSSASQYRWPVYHVANHACTNGRSPVNPGGVPTRCATNFDTMFNTLVPRPVTCDGTVVGTCAEAEPTETPTCHGVEATLVGTADADVIVGTTGDDVIHALGGDDTIHGRGGHDRICAGAGNDTVYGGLGRDRIDAGRGDDRVSGGAGHDHISGRAGRDELRGRAGNDWLAGGAGRDELKGGAGRDHLFGRAGNDWMSGGDRKDTLNGGAGRDFIAGGRGNDRLRGGPGNDRLSGGVGNDRLVGGIGNEVVFGGPGHDIVTGNVGDDLLLGHHGRDRLHGGDGNDRLFGGPDNDRLHGGRGNDFLDGGGGHNLLRGGPGINRTSTALLTVH